MWPLAVNWATTKKNNNNFQPVLDGFFKNQEGWYKGLIKREGDGVAYTLREGGR